MDIQQKISEYSAFFDKSPIACAIIHISKDEKGDSADFDFSYVNDAFASLQGYSREIMLQRSFYELFFNKKWLELFNTIAYEGGERKQIDYNPEIHRYLNIHCFQLCKGYCVTYILDAPEDKKLVELSAIRQKQELERQYTRVMGMWNSVPDAVGSFHFNLTQNLCDDGRAINDWILKLQDLGTVDGFFEEEYSRSTDPALLEEFKRVFNRKNLLNCFNRGETTLSFEHKYLITPEHSEWIITSISMTRNPDTWDVEGFIYARSINQEKNLQAIISRFVEVEYEYIALVDVGTGMLSMERPLDDYMRLPPISCGYYPEILRETVSKLILESDERAVQQEMSLEAIIAALERTDIYTCSFFVVAPSGDKLRKKWQFIYLDKSRNVIAFTRSDITKQYRTEYDEITGLFNRDKFYEATRQMLSEYPKEEFVLIRFDIDRFKVYNDIYGIKAGDRLLAAVGQLYRQMYRQLAVKPSVEGHLQADHFISCIPKGNIDIEKYITEAADYLRGIQPDFDFVPRIGIYEIVDRNLDVMLMCDRALLALRSIKGSYTDRIAFYNESMRRSIIEQQDMIREFETAIKEEQFKINIQPQYSNIRNEIIGAEVLVRWVHPTKGYLSPAKFIPIFEHNGFITILDEYVWEHTCRLLNKWKGIYDKILPLSVNVSRMDIYNPHLCDILQSLIQKYEIEPKNLRLEITETAYMDNPVQLIGMVKRLKDMGFYIEMDDFGNGYSSLNTLKNVPVDLLKLDMKFLSDDDNTGRSGIILNSIVRMAHWLQLPVLAEGVETRQQAEYLKSIGCDMVQGYYFACPMSPEDYEELLRGEKVGVLDKSPHELDLFDIQDFWISDSHSEVIFDSFVGAAGLFEFSGEHVEPIRANDKFFKLCGVSREKFVNGFINFKLDLSNEMHNTLFKMARIANDTGDEAECNIYWRNPENGKMLLLHLRGFVAARGVGRFVLLIALEDVTVADVAKWEPSTLEFLFVNEMVGIFETCLDEELTLLYGNLRYYQMLGFENAEDMERHLGNKTLKYLHPTSIAYVRKELSEAVLHGDKSVQFQMRIIRKDGKDRWVNCWGYLKQDSASTTLCGCLMDITESKETENQLAILNERYRIALENSSAAIWEYDYKTKSVMQSNNSIRIHGYGQVISDVPESLINSGYIHPDSVADYLRMYEKLRQGEKNVEGVFLVNTEGREGYWYEHISYTNLLSEDGQPYCAVGISHDVTDQRKAEEELRRRANSDAMTGLFNKMATEALIKEALLSQPGETCALMIADIDDLKSINDLLGHGQGDRAIIAISDTLKQHFRESDIIGRIGGDEYMIFLKGTLSEARLRGKLAALIRALSKLRVGEKDDIPVHASVGVVMNKTGKVDFGSLYKMADTALYQVKRGGKGNYAFYEPNMQFADYMYTDTKVTTLQNKEWFDTMELNKLLYAMSNYFPLIISINLTQNSYYMMEYAGYHTIPGPESGVYDELIQSASRNIYPHEQQGFISTFSRASLLSAYSHGKIIVSYECRQLGDDGVYRWTSNTAVLSICESDICMIAFARSAEADMKEKTEIIRLQKIMELAVSSSFEYIYLIHSDTGLYELYARNGKHTQAVPREGKFSEAIAAIRDMHVVPYDREEYFKNARLETVVHRMQETDGRYQYRYELYDGFREAQFYYFEASHNEILMTVRQIGEE